MNRVEKFSAFILLVLLLLVGIFPKLISELSNDALLRIYSEDVHSFESSEHIDSGKEYFVKGAWNE